MLSLLLIIALALCLNVYISASEFYFAEMPESVPGNFTVWKYDSTAKSATKLTEGIEGYYTAYDFVSGAAICGDYYYASAVEAMIAWGLLVVDTTTGKYEIIDNSAFGSLLIHNIWCNPRDPTGKSFYAVENNPNDANDNDFYLYHVTRNEKGISNEKIATFSPAGVFMGYDTMFQATEDVSEVWASWADKSGHAGKIQVMNTKSGSISEYQLEGLEPGYPYTTIPLETGKNSALAVLLGRYQQSTPVMAQVTLSGSVASVSGGVKASYGYCGGMPWAIEYSQAKAHTIVSNQEVKSLRSMDAVTGALLSDISMDEILGKGEHNTGGLAVRNN